MKYNVAVDPTYLTSNFAIMTYHANFLFTSLIAPNFVFFLFNLVLSKPAVTIYQHNQVYLLKSTKILLILILNTLVLRRSLQDRETPPTFLLQKK